LPWSRPTFGPLTDQAVLLADPGLVLHETSPVKT
jgi:hypothetical protein